MTRSTGRLANDAWESLMTAHARVIRRLSAAEYWQEVSMREYDVLYTLSKCTAAVRQSELERHVLLSQPAISRMVDRLEDRGLVARQVDPQDRRGVLLSLTKEGRATQRRIGSRHARDVARAVGGALSSEDMRQLERLTRALASAGSADEEGTQ